jgi:hypothetical protein
MAGMVDQHAGEMRSRYDTLNAAFAGLPATFANLVTRLREPDGRPALVAVFGYVRRDAGDRIRSPSGSTGMRCAVIANGCCR